MINIRNICLCIAILFSAALCVAQDLIIRKDGGRIYCRIIKTDSSTIYYTRKPQKAQFQISKTEVERYEISRPMRSEKTGKKDTVKSYEAKRTMLVFGLYTGLAKTLGDFKSKNLNNPDAGFARDGGIFHCNAIFRFAKYFGISAAYRYQWHRFDTELYDAQAPQRQPPGATYRSTSSKYKSSGMYYGFYFALPLKKNQRLWLDAELAAGRPKYTMASIRSLIFYQGFIFSETYSSATTGAFTLLTSYGFHYKVRPRVGLHVNLSVLSAKPTFKNILYSNSWGFSGNFDYTQPVSSLNLQAGLSFYIY